TNCASVVLKLAAALSMESRTRSSSGLLAGVVCWAEPKPAQHNRTQSESMMFRFMCPAYRSLPSHPDFVGSDFSAAVAHRLVAVDVHFTRDRLDDAHQLVLHRHGINSGDCCRIDLINQPGAVGINNYSDWMRHPLHRFIFEIDEKRGDKDEGQDERDH